MQKSKERLITFFDLKLSAYANSGGQKYDIAPVSLNTLVVQIEAMKAAGQCPRSGRGSAETLYLADIQVDTGRTKVALLINRSDKDASDTVYSDPAANIVRSFPKLGDEGNDFSAHVVIKLIQTGNSYLTILEVAPGLASGRVCSFLNFLFKFCVRINTSAFKVPHPNASTDRQGRAIAVTAYQKAALLGHPSQDFVNTLNSGILESIELIDTRKVGLNWDTSGHTKEIARAIFLSNCSAPMQRAG